MNDATNPVGALGCGRMANGTGSGVADKDYFIADFIDGGPHGRDVVDKSNRRTDVCRALESGECECAVVDAGRGQTKGDIGPRFGSQPETGNEDEGHSGDPSVSSVSNESKTTTLNIARWVSATPRQVWDAYTTPELFVQFFAPDGLSIPIESVCLEPRAGGRWECTMVFDETGEKHPNIGVFTEVDPPNSFTGFEPGVGLSSTQTFTDDQKGTLIEIVQRDVPIEFAVPEVPFHFNTCFDKLESLFAEPESKVVVSTHIAASAERVWELVSDVNLPSRFSAELERAEWEGDPGVGAVIRGYMNLNGRTWDTESVVIDWRPNEGFMWSVYGPEKPIAEWGFRITPLGDDVLLVMHARLGPARSGLTAAIEAQPEKRDEIIAARMGTWRKNMVATIGGVKDLAERR